MAQSLGSRRWVLLVLVLCALATGCKGNSGDASGLTLAEPCTLNSDCESGLVCTFGRCHEQCATSEDCPSGARCVIGEREVHACQLAADASCIHDSDCDAPLVCAVDEQCRNQCATDVDCIEGQVCTPSGFCADEGEVGSDGELTEAQCFPGTDCTPEGEECTTGTVDCDGATATCVAGDAAPDGSACGAEGVCQDGTCEACTEGAPCVPVDPNGDPLECQTGELDCSVRPAACVATGDVADETTCGTDGTCVGGLCAPPTSCVDGDPCVPEDYECYLGELDCSSTPATCTLTDAAPSGTACTGGACAAGYCVPCVDGDACTPADGPCVVGEADCSLMDDLGEPGCAATATPIEDGTYCATCSGGSCTCDTGACLDCLPSGSCVPENPCHFGYLDCSAGVSCIDAGTTLDDGVECGTGMVCGSGVCSAVDRVLTITAGDDQTAVVNATLSTVTLHVAATSDGAPVPAATITLVAPPGADAPVTVTTNAQGDADVALRVGRAPGTYTFTASTLGANNAAIDATATAPAAADIFPIVNASGTSGNAGLPGSGAAAQISNPTGLAVAADGTLYVATYYYCRVLAVAPSGATTVVAGTGTCAYNAAEDGGAADAAALYYPVSVALDEAGARLYIAESGRVRVVDLESGLIDTFAGGGANTGDNLPATSVSLAPTGVFVAPNGDVVISESSRLRVVSLATERINPFLANSTSCSSTAPLTFYGCPGSAGCLVAWDAAGVPFVAGNFCGADMGASVALGIARVASPSSLHHVAGQYNGLGTENASARRTSFPSISGLAFDAAGNLYVSDSSAHRLRRIEGASGRITTIAGTGTSGFAGDYGPATEAALYSPRGLAIDADQNVYLADYSNNAVRGVWAAADSEAASATLSLSSGTGQAVYVDQLAAPLRVRLVDAAGTNLVGFLVDWTASTPGAALYAESSATNASGLANVSARPGLAVGDYAFEAHFLDIHGEHATGSPASFTITATEPPSGTIFTVVNPEHSSGNDGVPGPGTMAHIASPGDVVVASDGTTYFTTGSYCNVHALSPAGVLSRVAGKSVCQYNEVENGGLAVEAGLYYPVGLALDEVGQRLFIAEYQRVRVVDLGTGTIDVFAGGGSASSPGYGDGGLATDATLNNPGRISYGPDGGLYISDTTPSRIRRVDPSGLIDAWLSAPASTACSSVPVEFYYCPAQCSMVWAPNGDAYITAYVRGTATGASACSGAYSVVRRSGTALTLVGGRYDGVETDGAAATNTLFPTLAGIARDATGNLYVSLGSNHRIRRISAGTNLVTTVVGDGTPAFSGEYVASTLAQVYGPSGIAATPGNGFVFADTSNHTVRRVW